MLRSYSQQQSKFRRRPADEDTRLSILVFVASLMTTWIALVLMLPRPVVLPAFSLCALVAAGTAFVAGTRLRAGASPSVAAWDLAGAFTLVGCAAAILGEVEAIIEYARLTAPRSKTDD